MGNLPWHQQLAGSPPNKMLLFPRVQLRKAQDCRAVDRTRCARHRRPISCLVDAALVRLVIDARTLQTRPSQRPRTQKARGLKPEGAPGLALETWVLAVGRELNKPTCPTPGRKSKAEQE